MFKLKRQETTFFDVFESAAEIACQSAVILQDIALHYNDPELKIKELEEKEHQGDQYVHMMMDRLNKSFITPIDREDLFLISKDLDTITDCIESTAQLFTMFNVQTVREDAKKIVNLIVIATRHVYEITREMKNFKKSTEIKRLVIEINRLENEGDNLFCRAVRELFTQVKDPIEVMKWKELFEYLEDSLDACEHVANIILGVVMKHA
jgi:uncharacterized protein